MSHKKILAAQFLEYIPEEYTPNQARQDLQHAFDYLPLNLILLGWSASPKIENAVAEVCSRNGSSLFQWHPLLTGDKHTPVAWRTLNLHGQPIPGHANLPEFTFICPNQPDVQEFISRRVDSIVQRSIYNGLFLDRIRFPSPALSPENFLGCFCPSCGQRAGREGLDLVDVRRHFSHLLSSLTGQEALLKCLFNPWAHPADPFLDFLVFRLRSITQTIQSISERLSAVGMETGLDCFSPSLAPIVGQDLCVLNQDCDWIKVMTYPRAYGPAGLPFELLGLLRWLESHGHKNPLSILQQLSGLELPTTISQLEKIGLPPASLSYELEVGRRYGVKTLLAGLALVNLPPINILDDQFLQADLEACREADGIVLSWDLRLIPRDTLAQIARFAGR